MVNVVCLDEGRSLYSVIVVATTGVYNLVLFVCLFVVAKLFPLDCYTLYLLDFYENKCL